MWLWLANTCGFFEKIWSFIIQPAVKFKKYIVDKPKENAKAIKEISKRLNAIEKNIEYNPQTDTTKALQPKPIPDGFIISHENLLYCEKTKQYFCYSCYLNGRMNVATGNEYTKYCKECKRSTEIKEYPRNEPPPRGETYGLY